MHFNSIDMWKYILGDLKLVDVYSDFDQNEAHFLIPSTNIWYNSAKPYTIMREDISLIKKKLERGEMGKIWSINPLFAVTHNIDIFQLFTLLL